MLDSIGAGSSIISTYLFTRLNSHAWLISFIAIAINTTLYWQQGIYASVALQVFYFSLSVYGWLNWQNTNEYPIRGLRIKELIYLLLILFLSIFTVFIFLKNFSNSSIPFLDAITATISVIAQLLLCNKIITTWILWLIADGFYIILFMYKQLPCHVILMSIYTIMAILGYWRWQRLMIIAK